MSLANVRLSLLVGPSVPQPAPRLLMNALESVKVNDSAGSPQGFTLTFRAERAPAASKAYALLNSPLLKPGNRVVISVTLNATPRVLMDGVITHHQLAPSGGIEIGDVTRITARVYRANHGSTSGGYAPTGDDWSPLFDQTYFTTAPASETSFAIVEINYHPHDSTTTERAAGFVDSDDFEYIELMNFGDEPIALTGVTVDGVEDVIIKQFSFDAVGTLHDINGIIPASVRLYEDNGSTQGYYDATDTLIQGSRTFLADNGTVQFVDFGGLFTVSPGTPMDLILVFDLDLKTAQE